MQTKRQFLLPLLTAATAMMVAPYAYSANHVYPGGAYVGGTAIANTDTLTVSATGATPLTAAAATTVGQGVTVTVNTGAVVTTSTNNAIYTLNGVGGAPTVFNIAGGALTANATSHVAIDGSAWTGDGANKLSVNLTSGATVTGDIILADGDATSATAISVDGSTWVGGIPTANSNSTDAFTLTLNNAAVDATTTPTHLHTLRTLQASYNVTATGNNSIKGNLISDAATDLFVNFDSGTTNTWTGNLGVTGNAAASANSRLRLGSNTATATVNLTVTGTIDTLGITQSAPGTLTVTGAVGGTATQALNFNGVNATAAFGSTVNSGANAMNVSKNHIVTVAGNLTTGAAAFSENSRVTVGTATTNANFSPTTLALTNNARATVYGNLTPGANAITVSDAANLHVTGNITNNGAGFTTAGTATATIDGDLTRGAVTIGSGTTATFKGNYTQNAASTNSGIMNVTGNATPTITVVAGGLTTNAASAVTTFGNADGSTTITVGGGNLAVSAGRVVINKNVTVNATPVVTGGVMWVGAGATVAGNITSTGGIMEFAPGSSLTSAANNNRPGAGGTFKIHGSSDAAGVVTGVAVSNAYTATANASAVTMIVFDDSANVGQLNVTGAATLTGSTFTIKHTGGYVAEGNYDVIVGTAAVNQTTLAAVIDSPSRTVQFKTDASTATGSLAQVNANKVTVNVTRPTGLNTYASASNAQALLASVSNVAKATFLAASAGQKAVLDFIENTVSNTVTAPSASAVNQAMKSLAPDVSSMAAANQAVRTGLFTLGGRLDAVAYDMSEPKAYVAGSNNGDAVWMRGTYTRVNQKANSSTNYDGYTSNQYGAMIGFDTMRFMHATLGLGLGYNQSNSKDRLDNRTFNRVRSYQVMPYGSVTLGDRATKGFIDWFAGYTYNNVNGTRMVANLGTNKYSYNSSIFSAKGTYGLDRVINRNLTFTPFVSALVSYQPSVTYTETGYVATPMKNESRFGLEFELGVKGVIRPDAGSKANTRIAFRAMGVWSAINNNLKSTMTLVGTQSYTHSVTQQKFGARAGVSGVFEVLNDLDLELSYDLEARSKYMSHTGFVEFKYHF